MLPPKWPARVAGGQPGLAGAELEQGKEEKLVCCRVCASHSSRRWAGARLAPPADAHQPRQAPAKAGTERAGRGSQGGSRSGVQNHGSHHAVSTVGTKRGRGWTPHPPALGTRGEWCPFGVRRWDSCNSRNWVGGAARQEAGIDWCPVDVLSSAPSAQPGLIGLCIY